MNKTLSHSEKVSSHGNLAYFYFKVEATSEQIVIPVKKA